MSVRSQTARFSYAVPPPVFLMLAMLVAPRGRLTGARQLWPAFFFGVLEEMYYNDGREPVESYGFS